MLQSPSPPPPASAAAEQRRRRLSSCCRPPPPPAPVHCSAALPERTRGRASGSCSPARTKRD
ncbi:unnamed protein product [Spirodela intermedia]|uniref:Uncharacterized protein n=1 Tax=Spirodela intermedia TaxID=51605 RepID=A0A7I8INI8_SPIIN|nr:unnamed protein product [Spirodela intermedia]CAA6659428.1 unnamed protein product [Spirodela intermedia]